MPSGAFSLIRAVLTPELISQLGVGLGVLIAGIVWAARQVGWIKQRTPSQEPRAEEMWRSEAEAQRQRAERLDVELAEVRRNVKEQALEIASLNAKIAVLEARPDFTQILERFDNHHAEMLAQSEAVAKVLGAIAEAVIPPLHIRGD